MVLTRSATAAAANNDELRKTAVVGGQATMKRKRELEDDEVYWQATMKRRREQLETENLELNVLEKRARIEAQTIANRGAMIAIEAQTIANRGAIIANQIKADMHVHANREAKFAVIRSIVNTISVINSSTALDASTRLALMDMMRKYIQAASI